MFKGLSVIYLLGVLCLAPFHFLLAQSDRASLGGRVTDAQGAVIPNAEVTVVADATGVEQHARTNSQGNWLIQFLLPGGYHFQVYADGFQKQTRPNVVLETSDKKTIDMQLALGASSQTVVVTAETPLIDTTAATSGAIVSGKEIVEMPSISRLPTDLAGMTAGVTTSDPAIGIAHAWSYNAASAIRISGGTGVRSNNYLLDGFPDVKSGGQLAFSPPPESLSEFRVLTNAYDASIGRQAGGTLVMTTKSGTSGYHGTLYEFNQNNSLNAKLFQTNLVGGARPIVRYNEYGGAFGGPVRIPKLYDGRKRTFFFVSWNGIRNQDPIFSTRSVPTELERQGNFSQSYTTQVVNGQRVRYPLQIWDPSTANAQGVRQRFQGNVIPVSRLNPIALNILRYVPVPNQASDGTSNINNNFVPNSVRSNKMASLSIRGDHQWNDFHKSFAVVRWSHQDEDAYNDFNNAATGGLQGRSAQSIGLDHVWTASSNTIVDLRFSIMRYGDTASDSGSGFDPTTLGFSPSFTSKLRLPSFPRINGIAGDFGTGQAGSYTTTNYYTWSGAVTNVVGNHTLRYGAEYWALQQAAGSIGSQGSYDFNNSNWTRPQATAGGGIGEGSPFAAYLLGLPNGGSVPVNADGFYSQRYAGLYFQDDWRATSKLTLNLGLRWDVERPVTERYNRMTTNFDPNFLNPTSAAVQANYASLTAAAASNPNVQALLNYLPANEFEVRGGQLFAGVNGQSRYVNRPSYHEFQPRIGFAYQLFKNTVLRGGLGRFSTATFDTGGQNGFNRTSPFTPTQDNYVTPYDTLSSPFQQGIIAPPGSSLGPLTNLGQGVSWLNQRYYRPYSLIFNFLIQHQIKNWLFEVGYTRNKAYGLAWDRVQNFPSFDAWYQTRAPRFDSTGRPNDRLLWDELVPNPFFGNPNYSGNIATSRQVALNQLIRPLAYLGDQTRTNNPYGYSDWNGLLVNVSKRFSSGFSFKGAFTWSKQMLNQSFRGPEIAQVIDHRLGGDDRPFVVSIAPVWELPIGRGKKLWSSMPKWADYAVGGWQLTGQYSIQSGRPITFSNNNFFYDGQPFAYSRDKRTLGQWFDTSHFLRLPDRNTDISGYPAWTGVQNLPGYNYQPRPGDTIRNGVYQDFGNYVGTLPTRWASARTDNVNNLNLGIYKNFNFFERFRLQYRFETYNTLNHPVFGPPNADPTSAQFGVVQPAQVNNARAYQMALKLYF